MLKRIIYTFPNDTAGNQVFFNRFKSKGPSDWDTGKWLMEDGGRINK